MHAIPSGMNCVPVGKFLTGENRFFDYLIKKPLSKGRVMKH